ncbi:YxjL [Bacillus atrophaeus UCMB-5137]|nr:YxjL [Bacillus atrophaeus UCMB-5137]
MSALPDTKIVILTTFDTEEYVFEGIRAKQQPHAEELAEPFTKRELEVLQQMAYRLRNEDIADKLFVTVKTHVHRILQKCDAQDRTQAVVFAIRNGIENSIASSRRDKIRKRR